MRNGEQTLGAIIRAFRQNVITAAPMKQSLPGFMCSVKEGELSKDEWNWGLEEQLPCKHRILNFYRETESFLKS